MGDNLLRLELGNLERKLVLLINEKQKLQQQVDILKSENESLKSQLRDREGKLSDFQNKDKITKIVNGMVGTQSSVPTELVEVINGYIKEVDKCIAQLSE